MNPDLLKISRFEKNYIMYNKTTPAQDIVSGFF